MSERFGLLLDTHYWLWCADESLGGLATSERSLISEAAKRGLLLVSVISVWEVGLLEAKGRIELEVPCEEWVADALKIQGLTLAPLTPAIAIESTRLPGVFHGDPADRIIAATARRMGARLMTRDRQLLAYGKSGHLRLA